MTYVAYRTIEALGALRGPHRIHGPMRFYEDIPSLVSLIRHYGALYSFTRPHEALRSRYGLSFVRPYRAL